MHNNMRIDAHVHGLHVHATTHASQHARMWCMHGTAGMAAPKQHEQAPEASAQPTELGSAGVGRTLIK